MIGEWLYGLSRRLQRIFRWQGEWYEHHWYHQSTAAHSWEMVVLAVVALEMEQAHRQEDQKLDGELVLRALAVHDMTEGAIGDILYSIKNDPRVSEALRAIEREKFTDLLRALPEQARSGILRAHELQNDQTTSEGRFFKALEYLEYILYAYAEYAKGHKEYARIFTGHPEQFLHYSQEFPGLRELYEPYREKVEHILASPHA